MYENPHKVSLYMMAIHECKWTLIAKNIKRAQNRHLEKMLAIQCIDEYASFHDKSVEDLVETLNANLGDTK